MILLNFGWMVDLAMSIFEFLIKSMVFWHPWHLWVCIRSVCWKWNLEQIDAIGNSSQCVRDDYDDKLVIILAQKSDDKCFGVFWDVLGYFLHFRPNLFLPQLNICH